MSPFPPNAAFRDAAGVLDNATFRRQLRRATLTLLVALLIPLLVLTGLVFYLRSASHWVDHTDQVIGEVDHVEKLLVTMQSGFRGYRLLHDETVLATYSAARAEIGAHLDTLASLISDNPRQVTATARLRADTERWIRAAEDTLARMRAGESAENLLPAMLASRAVMNSAVNTTHEMLAEEARLRAIRDTLHHRIFTSLITLFAVAACIGIPILSSWLQGLLREVSVSYQASLGAAERRATELEVTLNSIGDAVIATDAQGRVDFLNPAAETLMGWTNEEARGHPLIEVFPIFNEETGVVVANPVERVLRENVVVGLANHTVLRSRSGHEYPIEDSAAPIRGADGLVLGVILVFHDVTENRATARQLRDNEWRLRFLNDLGEATRTLAQPADIIAISCRLLGERLRAQRCAYAEVTADSDRFTVVHDYANGCPSLTRDYQLANFGVKAEGELRAGRMLVIRDLDTEKIFADSAVVFKALGIKATISFPLLRDGRLRAMLAVHDSQPRNWRTAEVELVAEVLERCWATLERARAEEALRQTRDRADTEARAAADSANRFQLLSEVVALQVWTATATGELDYANQECVEYFGGDLQRDILGNAWAQYVHADDLTDTLRAWQHSLATGDRYEREFRLRGRDGGFRWFLVRAEAMRDREGHLLKWFGSNTDIDELKRARDAAERASQAKDDFLAALSHELRTPLTPVLMIAESLRDDERLPADVREQLGAMERNIALEARLIDDLLDLTAISRGKLQFHAELCDAHALIALAVEIVRTDASTKGIAIDCQLNAPHSGLVADPARFQQIIWNLLRNAVKFTPRDGRISVATREVTIGDRRWLRIEVSDTGIGIDPALLDQIFLPFDQGGLTGDHRFGGIGLGLTIARAVVDLHGGRISAESGGPNQGARFIVEFPGSTEPPPGLATRTPAPTAAVKATAPLRLLLVEDHENTLETLQRLLQRRGHHIVTAKNVASALAAAATEKIDLVISDLGLPDGSGIELMEKLRDQYGLRGIALSGYGMEEDVARSREAGFVSHLVKPVHFPDLYRVISTLPPA